MSILTRFYGTYSLRDVLSFSLNFQIPRAEHATGCQQLEEHVCFKDSLETPVPCETTLLLV